MSLILSGTDGLSDVDGSAATPAIRGTDANTGIFFPAADTIAFAEGGAEAMRIDSSGNVGIGTTSPIRQLSVGTPNGGASSIINMGSGTSALGTLEFSDGTTGDDRFRGYVQYSHVDNSLRLGTDAVERMRIDSSGNVGIGTTPAYRMDVFTNVSGGNNITYNFSALNSASSKISYAALGFEISQGAAGIEAGAMIFRTYGSAALSERMRIDSSGNLLVA
jgi:hypothetical protein